MEVIGVGHANPFRWRGQYFDQETGLYYIGGRYYDPRLGVVLNATLDEAFMQGGYAHGVTNPFASKVDTFANATWGYPSLYNCECEAGVGCNEPEPGPKPPIWDMKWYHWVFGTNVIGYAAIALTRFGVISPETGWSVFQFGTAAGQIAAGIALCFVPIPGGRAAGIAKITAAVGWKAKCTAAVKVFTAGAAKNMAVRVVGDLTYIAITGELGYKDWQDMLIGYGITGLTGGIGGTFFAKGTFASNLFSTFAQPVASEFVSVVRTGEIGWNNLNNLGHNAFIRGATLRVDDTLFRGLIRGTYRGIR
jgi:RHS repeat-associated protein